MKKALLGVLLLAAIATAVWLMYTFSGESSPRADDTGATEAGVAAVVEASNTFAIDLLSELVSTSSAENIFFSPYSLTTALGMTAEGARGDTLREMRSVVPLPEDVAVRLPAVAALYNRINDPASPVALDTANALWVEQAIDLKPIFTEPLAAHYAGVAREVDFITNAEAARQEINQWVEERTNDKIRDLIAPGILTPRTRLVLTNAIYFKGNWLTQFEKANTRDSDFIVDEETTVTVPMMSLVSESFPYAQAGEIQLLELPYEGGELAMLIALPTEGTSVAEVVADLSSETLRTWQNSVNEHKVNVFLPRFTFETKYRLKEPLSRLGMPLAFTEVADFTDIADLRGGLWIDKVIHQAFVEVNEEGTEAAAATAVVTRTQVTPGVPPMFRANRPFLFFIHERDTGAVLFAGVVNDPTR